MPQPPPLPAANASCHRRPALLLLLLAAVHACLVGSSRAVVVSPGNVTATAAGAGAEAGAEVSEEVSSSPALGATASLQPLERFRRLIPYMTFYFAQEQGLGQRPLYTSYHAPQHSHSPALLQQVRPPPPPPPPPTPPPPLTAQQRSVALFRLLLLLQQRRAQQAAGATALAQTLALLQAASPSLPPPPPPPPPPPSPPFGGLRQPYYYTKAPALQVSTAAPDTSPDLLFNTVSPLGQLPELPEEEGGRVAQVEVSPNGHDVHRPLIKVTVRPPPPPPPPPAAPSRYAYAPKAPPAPPPPPPPPVAPLRPRLRPTFTQSFPDPTAKGGTPGRAGVDYPTLAAIPPTRFDCKAQRYKGFFGDPDTHCQVWHYCDLNGGQASFLCPNGTIFSQVALTCDWWFNVRCASTPQLYVLNERLYKYILPVAPSFPEDFSGPLVDRYLTLKFREQEHKANAKAKAKPTASPKPKVKVVAAQPTQNTLQDIEDDS